MNNDRIAQAPPRISSAVIWAITWPVDENGFLNSYCNTIPTPDGGSHEQGLRAGLLKSLKAYADLIGNNKLAASCGGRL